MVNTTRWGIRSGFILLAGLFSVLLIWAASEAKTADAQQNTSMKRVFALTTTDRLVSFGPNRPGDIQQNKEIRGLDSPLIGMDFRPANGRLYAVSEEGTIYMINIRQSRANEVNDLSIPLEGNRFGVDFNPQADALRIVSNTGQNLRVGEGGMADTTTMDGRLDYIEGDPNADEDPRISGVAYTNNVPAAASTELYYIDFNLDTLAEATPVRTAPTDGGGPNSGELQTVGPLGRDTTALVGFDIAPGYGNLAALKIGDRRSALFSVNLETGRTTSRGVIGTQQNIKDIAANLPVPAGD